MTNSYLSSPSDGLQQCQSSTVATRPLAQQVQQHHTLLSSGATLPASAVGVFPIVSSHSLVVTDDDGLTLSVPLVRADELPTYIQVATPSSTKSKILGQDFCFNKIMAYADPAPSNYDGHVPFNPSFHSLWLDLDHRRPTTLQLANTTHYGSITPFSPVLSNCPQGGMETSPFEDLDGPLGLDPKGGMDCGNINAVLNQLTALSLGAQVEPHSYPDTQNFAARQQYLLKQGLYRKEPCNAWRQKGHCKWGDKCTYSHDHRSVSALSNPLFGGNPIPGCDGDGGEVFHAQQLRRKEQAIAHLTAYLQEQQQAFLQGHSPTQLSVHAQQPSQVTQSQTQPSGGRLLSTAAPYKSVQRSVIAPSVAPSTYTLYCPTPLDRISPSPNTAVSKITAPLRGKTKGLKTHCTYFLRTGQCDFMQQGCKFSHERPEEPIMRTVGNETVVVVPGKNSSTPNGSTSSPNFGPTLKPTNSGYATKPRTLPINFASLNHRTSSSTTSLSRQASIESNLTDSSTAPPSSPDLSKEDTPYYSPLGGIHHTVLRAELQATKPLYSTANPHIRTSPIEDEKQRNGMVSSAGFFNPLANVERQQRPQAAVQPAQQTTQQYPIGSGRFDGKGRQSKIWGNVYRPKERNVEIMDSGIPDSEKKAEASERRGGNSGGSEGEERGEFRLPKARREDSVQSEGVMRLESERTLITFE